MITEQYFGHDALNIYPIKPKAIKKGNIEVGKTYLCYPRDERIWVFPFIGVVEAIEEKSAVVRILATQKDDDHLIDKYQGKTVVPLARMVERGTKR